MGGDDGRDGLRFEFGRNWLRFLDELDDARISEAERSLKDALDADELRGKRFLDIGSGSGLFSLAARRLGATVHSFDYDEQSVACTNELRRRYFPGDRAWAVERQSVLDRAYVTSLGRFDVVYSWGVLHHTGAMWEAIDNATQVVAGGGRLMLAIYNDQGWRSRAWTWVKRTYNAGPFPVRQGLLVAALVRLWGPRSLIDLSHGAPFSTWRRYARQRGMSPWRDVVDWVGGYPFEVATPEAVFAFCKERRMELLKLKTCGGGIGCNEFVFQRRDD